ncbi:MAG: DUF2996 domain-containing protein [Gloeomargarita sp. GXS_bins_116]
MSEAEQPVTEAQGAKEKAAAKAPPLEAKPLSEFAQEHFFPALKAALAAKGLADVQLQWLPEQNQVRGTWDNHEFAITFTQGTLQGLKTFTYSSYGAPPSTVESFMIDERKVTLDLLVFYTLQRLTAQKVLVLN